jgi:hypothetical protein
VTPNDVTKGDLPSKRDACLNSTRSRHPSVDGDRVFESKHSCSFDTTIDSSHAIRPPGRSPLPCRATCEAIRTRPRIPVSGVLEYWSIGVLRLLRIAPREREAVDAFRTHFLPTGPPGLDRWAVLLDHFMVRRLHFKHGFDPKLNQEEPSPDMK